MEHSNAENIKVVAYLKPHCGWSKGVRAILKKYKLDYEEKDIVHNRDLYDEMVQKSGQPLSPCVEVNDEMLADISGEELENYLLSEQLVAPSDEIPEAPINHCCSHKKRENVETQTVRFF